MRIEDLAFLLAAADRPGRSLLRVSAESLFFNVLPDPGGGGTAIRQLLPAPPSGFVRLWSYLSGLISTAVTTDLLSLNFDELATNQVIVTRFGTAVPLGGGGPQTAVPIIGGSAVLLAIPTIALASPRAAFEIRGIEPLLLGQEVVSLIATITAASGQTLTTRGRYVDLPI